MLDKAYRLHMKCMTWSRDTHGLFDYESNYITKWAVKCKTSGKLLRIENDIEFLGDALQSNEVANEAAKPLIDIKIINGKF